MLTAYLNAAMLKAQYEILPDGEGFFGKIEGLKGVWANAKTLEECRDELREVLEEWIVLGLQMGHHIPEVDGISLNVRPPLASLSNLVNITRLRASRLICR